MVPTNWPLARLPSPGFYALPPRSLRESPATALPLPRHSASWPPRLHPRVPLQPGELLRTPRRPISEADSSERPTKSPGQRQPHLPIQTGMRRFDKCHVGV